MENSGGGVTIRNEAARHLIDRIVELALSKKAHRPVLLDLTGMVDYTDHFLIMSGDSDIQVRAISDAITDWLKQEGIRPHHVEGYAYGRWVVIDLIDIVIHIFHQEERDFYQLEELWGDAPVMQFHD